ncbi:MAG TPA: MobF family relaxase, partial [Actinomycetales bacterium]|nr:MobF family relaxase [Actinomycetales bacterium]
AWALAERGTQETIYRAHVAALEFVIEYAERHLFTSRSGKDGCVQEDIRGVVGAAFDHWDSRAGDPQLHTHVVVMNRVQTTDGTWRTLDGRMLFRSTVALSEMYNAVLSDHLTAALGWRWEPICRRHSPVPKYEVAGVSEALQKEFSQRSAAIEADKQTLIAQFVADHGRQPTDREVLKLRQQATLQTRPAKQAHCLADLMRTWRERARPLLSSEQSWRSRMANAELSPETFVASLANRNDLPLLHDGELTDEMVAEVGAAAVRAVAEKRATFGRLNVLAETLRQLHGVRFATPKERLAVVERAVEEGLTRALLISPPELAHTPAALRRADGTSRFRARNQERYTTSELLDAESRLLDAGRTSNAPTVSTVVTDYVCGHPLGGVTVSSEQAAAVRNVVTSGRRVDVLVGAAGTGKSTTMAAVRHAWEAEHGAGSVVGLAPSAAAAEVLADVVGIPTENTAKWLTEHTRVAERRRDLDQLVATLRTASPSLRTNATRRRATDLAAEVSRWSLHEGQLIIVDEASMAATFDLDQLATIANTAGAKVLLVGDWAQLSPVNAGGAFHLLAHDRDGVAELTHARRFIEPWERSASRRLRNGEPDAVEDYLDHDRVRGGDRELVLDELYAAWRADTRADQTSLMVAADAQTVLDLNTRARADLVAAGEVAASGVEVEDGSVIGVGDRVVTRLNQRGLATGRGWVKNGDTWTVTKAHRDGSLTVSGRGGASARLPAAYVREHVELGYATTAHRAQGRTVDTAHAFVCATTLREPLYVMATRGRQCNRLYVDTMYDPDSATSHEEPEELDVGDVLRTVIANRGADVSATETIADEWVQAHSFTRLRAEYLTLARIATEQKYADVLAGAGLSPEQLDQVRGSPAWGRLVTSLRLAETAGLRLGRDLSKLVTGRSLAGTEDVAAVLDSRIGRWLTAHRVPQEARYEVEPPTDIPIEDPDLRRALEERRMLVEQLLGSAPDSDDE